MEQIDTVRALDRLDQELSAVEDENALGIIMGKYIADEFSMTEGEATQVFNLLKDRGVFPIHPKSLDNTYGMTAGDEYRIGIFTGIAPLYQNMHTTSEYEDWLSRALDVVLPDSGSHGVHANCHMVTDEHSCWTQEICPLKIVIAETQDLISHPDFESYEYLVKKEATFTEVLILIATLTKRGILTKMQEREMTKEYVGNYRRVFSSSQ